MCIINYMSTMTEAGLKPALHKPGLAPDTTVHHQVRILFYTGARVSFNCMCIVFAV